MTHVKALQAGQSSQGTYEPITPVSSRGRPPPSSLHKYMSYLADPTVYKSFQLTKTTILERK